MVRSDLARDERLSIAFTDCLVSSVRLARCESPIKGRVPELVERHREMQSNPADGIPMPQAVVDYFDLRVYFDYA